MNKLQNDLRTLITDCPDDKVPERCEIISVIHLLDQRAMTHFQALLETLKALNENTPAVRQPQEVLKEIAEALKSKTTTETERDRRRDLERVQ